MITPAKGGEINGERSELEFKKMTFLYPVIFINMLIVF